MVEPLYSNMYLCVSNIYFKFVFVYLYSLNISMILRKSKSYKFPLCKALGPKVLGPNYIAKFHFGISFLQFTLQKYIRPYNTLQKFHAM